MSHWVLCWTIVASTATIVLSDSQIHLPQQINTRPARLTRLDHHHHHHHNNHHNHHENQFEVSSRSSTSDRLTELQSPRSASESVIRQRAAPKEALLEPEANKNFISEPMGASSHPGAPNKDIINYYQPPAASTNHQTINYKVDDRLIANHEPRTVEYPFPAQTLPKFVELSTRQTSAEDGMLQSQSGTGTRSASISGYQSSLYDSSKSGWPKEVTSTEQTNNIHRSNGSFDSISPSEQYQQWPTESLVPQSRPEQSAGISGTNSSNSIEFNNHVVYEGPATVPPSSGGYYQTETTGPFAERSASNAWWALGFGSEFERASNLTSEDYLEYCSNSPLLSGPRQRSICRSNPKMMGIVARGIRWATDECQARFASSRWNCSLALQNQLDPNPDYSNIYQPHNQPNVEVFGEVMRQANRERSFLNAIIGAGLAHAITKACSAGEIPDECGCDKRIKTRNKARVEWIACSDDIDYGSRFSREFTDGSDVSGESETFAMLNAHNYEVGRRVFKSATDITCTCSNGDNGVCLSKRCWRRLGQFADIGEELMRRYESATHVQLSNKDPSKLRPVRRGVRKPKRKDLVFMDESPDYCIADKRIGVFGTKNRHCNSTSTGPDNCSLICCGRGYQVVQEEVYEDCNCKFVWCCELKCEKCKRQVSSDVCN